MTPLPRLIVIADHATAGGRLPEIIATAVDHGASAVVLRAREAATGVRVELAPCCGGSWTQSMEL